jgi:probable DNA repair protein
MDAAPNLIFSTPEWDGITELRMTPILLPLEDHIVSAEIDISHRLKDAFDLNLQSFNDPVHIPLLESEKILFTTQVTKGGTQLIQNQSHCPFKAFALHRLFTDTLELPEHDFDFAERGTLIHEALEIFWKKTRSQQNLKQLFINNTIDQQIEQSVREALLPFTEKLSDQFQFLQMELNRTRKLLKDWLSKEEQLRPDFIVLEEEKKETVQVGELRLSMRMDRVDKTADGQILLIDYKSGNATPNSWFGERPEQPQIPLYALQLEPGGMAFAQLKPGSMKFKGVHDPDTYGYGFKPTDFRKKTDCEDWQSLLTYWRTNLTHLANNFLSGQMQVDPLNAENTCRYCNLQTMCRIREKTGSIVDEEETP